MVRRNKETHFCTKAINSSLLVLKTLAMWLVFTGSFLDSFFLHRILFYGAIIGSFVCGVGKECTDGVGAAGGGCTFSCLIGGVGGRAPGS